MPMTWPLIERELRVGLRKRQPRHTRFWFAVCGCALSLAFLFFSVLTGDRSLGRSLHSLLHWCGIVMVFNAPRFAVGMFSEDRRNDTLGLLFLCGIGPGELFVSKLLGTGLIAFSNLLGLFPFLALSFLMGGVSMDLFIATLCSLPLSLMFAISVCTLASVLCKDEGTAHMLAMALGAALCLAMPLLRWASGVFSDGLPIAHTWLALSPAFPVYVAATNLTAGSIHEFWLSCGTTLVWSGLCLLLAGVIVQRIWQDRPMAAEDRSAWARAREFMQGSAAWRRRLAQRWLDRNPFAYLAVRDRWPASLAWIAIGSVVLIWFTGLACWPAHWPSVPNFFATGLLLNLILAWTILYAAAKPIGMERRNGGLELLLTTPLTEQQIIHGQLAALRAHFHGLGFAVFGLDLTMIVAGFCVRSWTWRAVAVYLLVWAVLVAWSASYCRLYRFSLKTMADSLICGRPAHAVWRNSGLSGSPVWTAWFVFNLVRSWGQTGAASFPTGSQFEFAFVFVLAGFVLIVVLLWLLANKQSSPRVFETILSVQMRRIAQEPVPEPSDPRFSQWKRGELFPFHTQNQLSESEDSAATLFGRKIGQKIAALFRLD